MTFMGLGMGSFSLANFFLTLIGSMSEALPHPA